MRKYKKKICLFCLVAFCSTRLQEQFPNEVKGRANDQNSKKTDPSSPILSRETQGLHKKAVRQLADKTEWKRNIIEGSIMVKRKWLSQHPYL